MSVLRPVAGITGAVLCSSTASELAGVCGFFTDYSMSFSR